MPHSVQASTWSLILNKLRYTRKADMLMPAGQHCDMAPPMTTSAPSQVSRQICTSRVLQSNIVPSMIWHCAAAFLPFEPQSIYTSCDKTSARKTLTHHSFLAKACE